MAPPSLPLKLARDASNQILFPFILGLVLLLAGFASHYAIGDIMTGAGRAALLLVFAVPGGALVLYALFLVWFFRDPDRVLGPGLVSPADGRVLFVEPYNDPDVGAGTRVAIFMSPLDVHVNRVPCSATLESLEHRPGGYLPAFEKESERNERVVTVWRATGADPDGPPAGTRFKVVQIAGALARRIVPWVEPGAALGKGARYGMIRLGSRVDVHLPAGISPTMRARDRVRAGATTLGRVS